MLDQNLIHDTLSAILENGADFGELFLENRISSAIDMTDGAVDTIRSGRTYGAGIRGFLGIKSVYAYTNDVSKDTLIQTAINVGKALKSSERAKDMVQWRKYEYPVIHFIHRFPSKIKKEPKVAAMRLAHEGASTYSDTISQVQVWYLDYDQEILIANTEGIWAEDRRVRTRLMVQAVASNGSEKETGFEGPGAAKGTEFLQEIDPRKVGAEAARVASRMIQATHAPAGTMPVVISNAFGGVIFHEACGHSLEATSVAKGSSVFAGKLGQKIAAECVSAVDDGTIANAWGSNHLDDEGVPTQRTILIEQGVLKGYLVDKLGGRKMQMEPTGCSRRQDYQLAPTSRMSNTFIMPGKDIPEEIIADTEYGLYAKKLGGGSVMPGTGEFNFAVNEGYLIEKGRITKPVRGATLIGKGHEILLKIDRVANDLAFAQGNCGSLSGSVPAGLGQPTIRVSEMIVGGRNE